MRKIAIIKIFGYYKSDYDSEYSDHTQVIQSVTDFQEIDDATFDMLWRQLHTLNNKDYSYMLIEQQDNVFTTKTVADYKKRIQEEQKKREKIIADELARKAEAAVRKAAKVAKTKQQKFEELAKELGVELK